MKLIAVLLALVSVALVLVFAPIALLFALPWIAAPVWIAWRGGWSLLWPEDEAFPSQSSRLRGFGGRGAEH